MKRIATVSSQPDLARVSDKWRSASLFKEVVCIMKNTYWIAIWIELLSDDDGSARETLCQIGKWGRASEWKTLQALLWGKVLFKWIWMWKCKQLLYLYAPYLRKITINRRKK
jgi:hypothetical protein